MATEGLRRYETKATIARLFGLTGRRIEQLSEDGVIEKTKLKVGVRYNTEETIRRYIEYLNDKASGRAERASEAELKLKKMQAEIQLKESQGELHQLRTDIALGRYIEVKEAKEKMTDAFLQFRWAMDNMPARVTMEMGLKPEESRALEGKLRESVRRSLREFVERAAIEEGPQKKNANEKAEPEAPKRKRGRPPKNAKTQ